MGYSAVALGWMLKLFLIYTLMTVFVPYVILRPVLKGKAVSLQLMVCVVFSHFYYINIVLFLGLFHITSGTVYLIVFLLPLVVKLIRKRRQIAEAYILPAMKTILRLVHGENSIKFCLHQLCRWLKDTAKRFSAPIRRVLRRNILEGVLFAVCMAFLVMYFAPYFYEHFGYRASDMVVHQQWINALDEGVLFYDGIYPMGMHAVIYYIHAVFGIHTYVLMQFFPFVADLYVFVMLLIALKTVCRFRYLPYIGFFCLIGADYIQSGMLSRYMAALPQEFGMMFYLPCLVAAIQFFRVHIREDKERQKLKEKNLLYTAIGQKNSCKESTLWLWVLIVSFGLTFAVHFYITILSGILMAAVALGYAGYVFRPRYLRKLALAAIISIVLPLMPMVLAFISGTPLQGSLYWATSVMGIDLKGAMTGESSFEEPVTDSPLIHDTTGDVEQLEEKENAAPETLGVGIRDFYVDEYLMLKNESTYHLFMVSMGLLLVQIVLMLLFKEWEYSRILTAVLVNQVLMTLIGISGMFGLPVLIDPSRMAAFQAYATPLCIALAADSCVLLCSKLIRKKALWQGTAFALTAGFIGYTVLAGNIKKAEPWKSSLQTDGAAMCLNEIIEKYPEHKWTIVSCNEERNMMSGTGWHYEVIDFLQAMEDYEPEDVMQIPTQYVFFYIEKESLNYDYDGWADSIDPTVSEAWAEKELPPKSGLTQYQGTNRIILNSRMYYWMQEYMKRYPNDIKVYYEDDEFVCYFMEQNEYYLHNFAIDYGYNAR